MTAWKSAPFPYDLILEIPYDVKVENNTWIERHWKKLLRVLDVLVGPPGAVVALIPAELLLPYAKALDYVVKRGKIKLGDVVIALKPAPVVPVD